MAVTLISDARRKFYVGLSSDSKPSASVNDSGDRFYESDTGDEYEHVSGGNG